MTKPTKWHMRAVWTESSLSTWRNIWPLTTYWVHSDDSDQTGRMPWLIWVFAHVILLVLLCGGSFVTMKDVPNKGIGKPTCQKNHMKSIILQSRKVNFPSLCIAFKCRFMFCFSTDFPTVRFLSSMNSLMACPVWRAMEKPATEAYALRYNAISCFPSPQTFSHRSHSCKVSLRYEFSHGLSGVTGRGGACYSTDSDIPF